eukprot:SAG31_NODE_427_length_15813_cov_13.679649_17_plen_80_part_00
MQVECVSIQFWCCLSECLSMRCSYNKVQPGQPASAAWSCENPTTLGDLKHHLNFSGWVMSDWDATHSTSLSQVRAMFVS